MENVTINGIEYAPVRTSETKMQIICVDNRGLTFVGHVEHKECGWTVIHDARCVIRWGTTGHIAELADKGPQENTRLGYQKTVTVRTNNVQFVYDCGDAWHE